MSDAAVIERVNGILVTSINDAVDTLPSADLQRMYRAAHAAGDRLAATQLWEKWVAAKCREGDRPDALRRDVGTPVERFWACVVEGPDGHMFWDGPLKNGKPATPSGKGSNHVVAARFAYKLKHGPIPDNFAVYATCGEMNCLNVEHLAAAHAPTMRNAYRHEAMIGAVQACALSLGRTPTLREYAAWRERGGKGRRTVPTVDTLMARLGSWSNAVTQAGLEVRPHYQPNPKITDDEICAALRGWAAEHGRPPSNWDWQNGRMIPSASTIGRRWNGWQNALKQAGLV